MRFKKLNPAQEALTSMLDLNGFNKKMTCSTTTPRIWSWEYQPYLDPKSQEEVSGKRGYAVCSIDEIYKHLSTLKPEDRNWYEMIYGSCFMYGDYDLSLPSNKNVRDAHAEFTRCLKHVLKDQVSEFREHVLTANTKRKESMHVKWEFLDQNGCVSVITNPDECRKIVSAALKHSIETCVNLETNPLFKTEVDEDGKKVTTSIFDMGVFNNRRNFRLHGNVKPRLHKNRCDGWLVRFDQASIDQKVFPSKEEFLRDLICLVPASCNYIDTSTMPDLLDYIRRVLEGAGPEVDITRYLQNTDSGNNDNNNNNNNNNNAVVTVKTPIVRLPASVSQFSLEKHATNIVKLALAFTNPSDFTITQRSSGFFILRMVNHYCVIKGAAHGTNYDTRCHVHLSYPRPNLYINCFSDKCIAKMAIGSVNNQISLDETNADMASLLEVYKKACEDMLHNSTIKNNMDFFYCCFFFLSFLSFQLIWINWEE